MALHRAEGSWETPRMCLQAHGRPYSPCQALEQLVNVATYRREKQGQEGIGCWKTVSLHCVSCALAFVIQVEWCAAVGGVTCYGECVWYLKLRCSH